jgi:putative transposase
MGLRRYYVPDAIVFITQVVQGREPIFRTPAHVELLRNTLHQVKALHPFAMLGYVFLPEHLHLMLAVTGSSTFSQIMHSLKPNFTKAYKQAMGIDGSLRFWQRRFYDHLIRNEDDFARHLDYIHYNPVKHRAVSKPEDWLHSSFLAWKERGIYEDEWGWVEPETLVSWDRVMGE